MAKIDRDAAIAVLFHRYEHAAQGGRNRTRRIQKLAEPEILPTFEELDADVPF